MNPDLSIPESLPWTLTLVRHGETNGNSLQVIHGWTDEPLNETGRWQVSRLSDRLKSNTFTHVFTSDLSRACATTAAVMRVNDSTADIVTDGRLREQYYGVFENRSFQEWFSTYGSWEDTLEVRCEDGENLEDVATRVGDFFSDLCDRVGESFLTEAYSESDVENDVRHIVPERNVLVVCHEHTIHAFLRIFRRIFGNIELSKFAIDNTGINVFKMLGFRKEDMRMCVQTINDTAHLRRDNVHIRKGSTFIRRDLEDIGRAFTI